MFTDLASLVEQMTLEEDKAFPRVLLQSLLGHRRFPNGYKNQVPFNCLTLLDPRYTVMYCFVILTSATSARYMDIYFSKAETDKAINDISLDHVFDNMIITEANNTAPNVPVQTLPTMTGFSARRYCNWIV